MRIATGGIIVAPQLDYSLKAPRSQRYLEIVDSLEDLIQELVQTSELAWSRERCRASKNSNGTQGFEEVQSALVAQGIEHRFPKTFSLVFTLIFIEFW